MENHDLAPCAIGKPANAGDIVVAVAVNVANAQRGRSDEAVGRVTFPHPLRRSLETAGRAEEDHETPFVGLWVGETGIAQQQIGEAIAIDVASRHAEMALPPHADVGPPHSNR